MSERTNLLSLDQPKANMFGVVPCPKCRGVYRYPMRRDSALDAGLICCDDCGFQEPWEDE